MLTQKQSRRKRLARQAQSKMRGGQHSLSVSAVLELSVTDAGEITAGRETVYSPKDGEMNLGPVSYLDCIVFCVFLAPQLLWQAGAVDTVLCVLQALPFVCECSVLLCHRPH